MADDTTFSVPEPEVDIGSGFLSEYWKDTTPLPRLTSAEMAVYYMREATRSLSAMSVSTVITILTISTSIFIFGGFLLLLRNVDLLISSAGSQLTISAYVDEHAPIDKLNEFVQELQARPDIRSVTYLSKEDALQQFREDLGTHSSLLAGLEVHNPLPASIDLVMYQPEVGVREIDTFVTTLRKNPLVSEVVYGSEWVQRAGGVLALFRGVGMISALVVLALVMFLVGNTIKLVMYARRDELQIMQLVGAAQSFIKIPLVVSGALQGFVGAVVGIAMLQVAFLLLNARLGTASVLGVGIPEFAFLSVPITVLILFIGVFVGSVGSYVTMGRFLNV